jgi:hypothetical protein
MQKPKAYEPRTIPTPAEAAAPEAGSRAAAAKAAQDSYWSQIPDAPPQELRHDYWNVEE